MLKRLASNTITDDVDAVLVEVDKEHLVEARLDERDGDDHGESDEEDDDLEEASTWLDSDIKSFLISLGVHLTIIIGLAMVPVIVQSETVALLLQSTPIAEEEEPEFKITEDIAYSDTIRDEIGANSEMGTSLALSQAPVVADISEIPSVELTELTSDSTHEVSLNIRQAIGVVEAKEAIRGMTGVGATGTDGAVDRITYELLRSLEERPTLVVWLFDASGSLTRRRQEIRERFYRIYDELGIVQKMRDEKEKISKKERNQERLLTSIFSFGERVELLTPNPTADLGEITSAIDSIEMDASGVEQVFTAVYLAGEKYKSYRSSKGGHGAARNVMMVVVTDERGDDNVGLEKTVELCRKFAMPVYVMGVPAPFGREFTYIKYVDPDPQYDQSPQWAQIDQGPETYYPERIHLGYEDNYFEEPIIDSGFGPFALSRLCYETGGIYFTIHPNRKFNQLVGRGETEAFASHLSYFFDPDIMERYRPDYVSEVEYAKRLREIPLRQALLQASRLSRVGVLERPRLQFIKRDESQLVNELTAAQQEAARLEPKLYGLCELLAEGAKHRDRELSARWLASFDYSFGTALAEKVRTESYNLMLAKAKRGMAFEDAKNNTWTIRPSGEISVGSKLEKEAELAKGMLKRVLEDHRGTPWALLAQRELDRPIGWTWIESFTDLAPPPPPAPASPPPAPPMPADDQVQMIARPPTRPIPKL